MSKTYNKIGSLTTLKTNLKENKIDDFKSLKEVIDFQNTFEYNRKQLIAHHRDLIEKEKNILEVEIVELAQQLEEKRVLIEKKLSDEINLLKSKLKASIDENTSNILLRIIRHFTHYKYLLIIKRKENEFEESVKKSTNQITKIVKDKESRFKFITTELDNAVKKSAHHSVSELERKKVVIDNLNSFIYGALGEQKVVKELEKLSDEYFLINDFSVSLTDGLYWPQENETIKSVQIDHILIGPSGIFLIETKNWSEKSLHNLCFRSPVKQVRRANFVLFYLLKNEVNNSNLHLKKHHWGDKKIAIKNLIVMTNTKPIEEFQFVKILTLNELIGYVHYFKPLHSSKDAKKITDFLLDLNEQQIIVPM